MLDDDRTDAAGPAASSAPLAGYGSRAGALAVDTVFGLLAIAVMALVVLTSEVGQWLWWVATVVGGLLALALLANRWVAPTLTGWTLGRALFGIRVLDRHATGTTGSPTPWRLAARDVAHLLDTASLLVGWVWPLWDRRRRTFADLLARTEARAVPPPQRDVRRLLCAVLGVVTLLGVAAAVAVSLTVYRAQYGAQQAREQISVTGPGLVSDILSYRVDTVDDDFRHAQTLVTEAFREQLAAQQDAARSRALTNNEYWSVNSAVETATADHATMLLFLRGQRGDDPAQQEPSSASVRAEFVRSDGRWLVDNLLPIGVAR